MKTSLLLCFVLLAAGCATGPVAQQVTFFESELTPFKEKGNCRVRGEAFAKTKGGDVKVAAGNAVFLVPDTPYTRERWEIMKSGRNPAEPHAALATYVRRTAANSKGEFSFINLPPGAYLIHCRISWMVPNGTETGGYILARVVVSEEKPAVRTILRPGKEVF